MDEEQWRELLKRYVNGDCTDEERTIVDKWYRQLGEHAEDQISRDEITEDIRLVHDRIPTIRSRARMRWMRYSAAAAIVLISLIATLSFLRQGVRTDAAALAVVDTLDASQLLPGSDKAILELADGRIIAMDDVKVGILGAEGGSTIVKDSEGSLVYRANNTAARYVDPVYNTFRIPRGGQFRLTLPDGSKVWLNAESSITYAPNRFTIERSITLEGEAFFDVVTDPKRPFTVKTARQTVTVHGTQFNINSYADEPGARTTLVEGSVSITNQGGQTQYLRPGQVAIVNGGGAISVQKADVAHETAWKNGLFHFDGTDLEAVMRQLSRWYDVDVVFKGKQSAVRLWGEVNRNTSAATPLELLNFFELRHEVTQVNGRRRITIFD